MDVYSAMLQDTVRRALAEDLGGERVTPEADLTSRLAVPAERRARARIVAKAKGIVAGIDAATESFRQLDGNAQVEVKKRDGDKVVPGEVVLAIEAQARGLLAAERTALNFLQRLSGIATQTRGLADAVAGTGARILDTRKTTPGLRFLEKRAVVAGGGHNHRAGLHDQVLLKENHFALAAPMPYEAVVRRCVDGQAAPVVAEARTCDEALAAVRGGAAVVLLDNFAPDAELRAAVAAVRQAAAAAGKRVEVEASGGVNAGNARAFADCGVDRISVGALTHSAPALDLSLLVEGVR
jgi:nicotinate-nucleotide pyrophosphorylase (carboxylating)